MKCSLRPCPHPGTESKKVDFIRIVVVFSRLDPQGRERKDEAADNQKFHGVLKVNQHNQGSQESNLYQWLMFVSHLVANESV